MKQPTITIRMDTKTKALAVKQAKLQRRTLTQYIINLIHEDAQSKTPAGSVSV